MTSRIGRYIAAAALSLAGPAVAGVQVQPGVKLIAEQRYDDGILLGAPEGGGGQLMTKLSPQVSLGVKDPTLTMESWYSPDFMYRYGSGASSLDHRGRVTVKKNLSRLHGLRGDVQLWRVTDPTSLPRLGMARSLSPVAYGKGELTYFGRLSERWNGRAGYRLEAAHVFEADSQTGVVHSPFLEAEYALSRRTGVGGEYRFQYFQLGGEHDYAHGLFGTLRHRLTEATTFNARGGPIFFERASEGEYGVMPRATLELARDGETLDVALLAGYDLVGASGFTSALWAQFASAVTSFRVAGPVHTYGAVSYFRNGRAPGNGFELQPSRGTSQGYALGAGIEWRYSRELSLVGAVDRIEQVGDPVTNVTRNIASLRMQLTAF